MGLEDLLSRSGDGLSLHEQYLNPQMIKVLRMLGFDKTWVRAEGPYLFDEDGEKYLDLLSGFGVFAAGRNHPKIAEALKTVIDRQLPNLVQLDASILAGELARRLVDKIPGAERMFFCNSGAEAVEAAMKFSRRATARSKIVYCDRAFHGLTYGALSLNGEPVFREGFGPLLPDCHAIPFNDLGALERVLRSRDVAAFIVEPIQEKCVYVPDSGYFREVRALCDKFGTLLVADEVQTGLGRTGAFLAIDHFGVEPDIVCLAKALSGGFVPVGAVSSKAWIFDKVFNRPDRAVVHGSTFSKNNLAMAAGLATLEVIEEEKLVENAALRGEQLLTSLRAFARKYELVKDVRGMGLLIGIEFGSPKSLSLRAAWKSLETAKEGLFSQMITIPLLSKQRVLAQISGAGALHVVRLTPPLSLSTEDVAWATSAFDAVIEESHKVPGAVWDLGRTLAGHLLKSKAPGLFGVHKT